MKTLIDLVNSTNYNGLIESIRIKTNIEIDNKTPVTVPNYYLERLRHANIKPDHLKTLIDTSGNEIISFVDIKLRKYANDKKQEYPKGYKPEQEDDHKIVYLPFSKNFLIGYLLEYWILKESPLEIEKYVRAVRIPNAKKYAKEITAIYNDINSSK